MADKTWGVKISDEYFDKVESLYSLSDEASKKVWFEKLIALAEVHSVKEDAIEYRQDLNELEVHTRRIYELITNMVQRAVVLKESAVREVTDKLDQKEAVIGEYQEKARTASEELKQAQELIKGLEKEKVELSKQLEQSEAANQTKQLLFAEYDEKIAQYKEKIDMLTGIANEYQSYADENKKLKEDFAAEREKLKAEAQEYFHETIDLKEEIERLNNQIEDLKEHHKLEIERKDEKAYSEKNIALLELEREYQQRLTKANEYYAEQVRRMNEAYSNQIQKMYAQINLASEGKNTSEDGANKDNSNDK